MCFRLVPKSVTLNDLKRRNGPYFAVILPNSVVSGAHCVNVVEDTCISKLSAQKCSAKAAKQLVFSDISLTMT